jgi:hypothetical protein
MSWRNAIEPDWIGARDRDCEDVALPPESARAHNNEVRGEEAEDWTYISYWTRIEPCG